jgi:hypothetical protein
MFDMTNDSNLFRTRQELEADGFYLVAGNVLKRRKDEFLPLYVGRMIRQFDHRAASVRFNPENLHNPFQSEDVTEAQHQDPGFAPRPQFWVPSNAIEVPFAWCIAFRDIARVTDERTMIAAAIPPCGVGNTLPLILPEDDAADYRNFAPLLLANLNSLAFDYVARQKVQSTHLNWYIVEQLPVLPGRFYDRAIGDMRADALVRDEVLHLTYTATDMESFARDMGFEGDPFAWDEEDRLHRRCRLDALYFMMYGLDGDTAAYILDTFPIVREDDTERFGRYLTKDLILAYMRAFEAGDARSRVAV